MQNSEFRIQKSRSASVSLLHSAFCILHSRALCLVVAVIAVTSIATAAESPLLDASERGDRATALKLLAKGANVNTPGPDGTTAIMYAAANDDIELVRA